MELEIMKQILNSMDAMNARLDVIDARLDKIDARLDAMDARLDAMDARMDTMQADISILKDKTTKIEVTQETEIIPNIKVIAENHVELYNRLTESARIDNEKEMLYIRMGIAEKEIKLIKKKLAI